MPLAAATNDKGAQQGGQESRGGDSSSYHEAGTVRDSNAQQRDCDKHKSLEEAAPQAQTQCMRRGTKAKARQPCRTDAACCNGSLFVQIADDALGKQGCCSDRGCYKELYSSKTRGDAYLTAAMCRTVIHRLCLSLLSIMACSGFQSVLLIVQLAGIPTSSMDDSLQLLLRSDTTVSSLELRVLSVVPVTQVGWATLLM